MRPVQDLQIVVMARAFDFRSQRGYAANHTGQHLSTQGREPDLGTGRATVADATFSLVLRHSQELGLVVVDEATSPSIRRLNRTRCLVHYPKIHL